MKLTSFHLVLALTAALGLHAGLLGAGWFFMPAQPAAAPNGDILQMELTAAAAPQLTCVNPPSIHPPDWPDPRFRPPAPVAKINPPSTDWLPPTDPTMQLPEQPATEQQPQPELSPPAEPQSQIKTQTPPADPIEPEKQTPPPSPEPAPAPPPTPSKPQTPAISKNTTRQTADAQTNARAEAGYRQQVIALMDRRKRHPAPHRRYMHGTVAATFHIQADGSISNLQLTTTSRYEPLNQATIDLVQSVNPLPPPPGPMQISVRIFYKRPR